METSTCSATDQKKQITYCRRDNPQVPIFFWLLPMLKKIDAARCEMDARYHSQNITKGRFKWQLSLPHEKKIYCTNFQRYICAGPKVYF